jgi:phage shock protein PspC (stress-responsive transcriptional regulator)
MRAYIFSVICILSIACSSTNGSLVKPSATRALDEPAFDADVDSDVLRYVPDTIRLLTAEHAAVPFVTPVLSVDSRSVFRDEYFLFHWNDTKTAPIVTWYPRLIGELMYMRKLWLKVNPGIKFPGVIGLAVDKDVPVTVVRNLVVSATVAGFPDVTFYVRRSRATQHIGILHVNGRLPVFRSKIDWTNEHYVSIAADANNSVGYAWYRDNKSLSDVRGTNTAMLGDALRESFPKFAKHQTEHDRGINWALLDADGTLPTSVLIPVLDALEIPRRKYRLSDSRVIEAGAFEAILSVDEKDIAELWRNWSEANVEATRIAGELEMKLRNGDERHPTHN